MKKDRNASIDIVKGIAIILMVAGHAYVPFIHFIYLFHMAAFFIASGYCYNEKNPAAAGDLFHYILKRIKGLYLPYVVWNSIFSILHNFFIRINFYSDNIEVLNYYTLFDLGQTQLTQNWTVSETIKNIGRTFLFGGATEIGGPMWFLAVLFEVSVVYAVVDLLINKIMMLIFHFSRSSNRTLDDLELVKLILQGIVSGIFLAAGFYFSRNGIVFHNLTIMLTVYCLYFIGLVMRKSALFQNDATTGTKITIAFLSFITLLMLNRFVTISIASNTYDNPMALISCSFAGFVFLYEISDIIKDTFLKKPLVLLGQNTLYIMIFHFSVFKLINKMAAKIMGMPDLLTAVFPVLLRGRYIWIIYTVFGVGISLCISLLVNKVKTMTKKLPVKGRK